MIIMILFPQICMEGTKEGMMLWYQSIVPTLLPYMMLSNMLMNTNVLKQKSVKNRFFSLNTWISIFIGFMCGYPMGAHFVSGNYKSGNISKYKAYWLLSFVNICSPAFIIQYIVLNNLNTSFTLPMLISIYGSAIAIAIITFPFYYYVDKKDTSTKYAINEVIIKNETQPIIDAMLQCLKLLGYIILFSIILNMVTALINTVTIRHIVLIGILEITNGIAFASENARTIETAALLMSAFTAFGSISCIFQTKSVCKDSQLKMFPYIIAKVIQAIFSLLIMYFFIS